MTTAIQTSEQDMAKVATLRDGIAARIRELAQRFAENAIALGRELKRARDSFPREAHGSRPGWAEWVQTETGISEGHSRALIRISEQLGGGIAKLGFSTRVLTYMVKADTPERGVDEIIERGKKGEAINLTRAKEIVAPHREYPKPKEANEKAKETGKAILASDGNYYFGTSKETAEAYERKKQIVYGVRRAVEALAEVGMTPDAFLEYADKHQLWRLDEEHLLTAAHDWLGGLLEAWENR